VNRGISLKVNNIKEYIYRLGLGKTFSFLNHFLQELFKWGFHESRLSSWRPKNFMAFVSTGKCSAKVTCNGEYEKLAGVNFTILVFSIFLTS